MVTSGLNPETIDKYRQSYLQVSKIGESWSEINCPTVHQNTFRENGVERLLSVTASVIQTASSSHATSSSEIACLSARAAHNCLSNTFASYHSYFIVKLSL